VFVYARPYTQTTWVLDVSPGMGQTPGEPEESRLTKAQYTCRLYRCTQYICPYIYWVAVYYIISFTSNNKNNLHSILWESDV